MPELPPAPIARPLAAAIPAPIPAPMQAPPDRPLQGLTILLVEDSRFASEALRLMCLRSGARLRRADCLAAAWRHLRTYRPDVLIVDLGLPDGPGTGLIAGLQGISLRPPVVLAISGESARAPAALTAGADGFIEKPLESLAAFQQAILHHLPAQQPGMPAMPPGALDNGAMIAPDPLALRDDLQLAARILAHGPDAEARAYLRTFLGGIARSAHDAALARAVEGIAEKTSGPAGEAVERLARLLRRRLQSTTRGPLGTARRPETGMRVA